MAETCIFPFIELPEPIKSCLPEGRSVVSNDDELGLAQPETVKGLFVAKEALAGLHDKGETRVDALIALLDLLLGSHLLGI